MIFNWLNWRNSKSTVKSDEVSFAKPEMLKSDENLFFKIIKTKILAAMSDKTLFEKLQEREITYQIS